MLRRIPHLLCLATLFSLSGTVSVAQQRVLGLDVSAWQGSISQTTWNNIHNVENRKFVFIRSSRGGTTGYYNQSNANNDNPPGQNTYSQRYDDPYYIQNINRATTAGLLAGSYHFSRPDIIESTLNSGGIANTGTDEADHFIQMAGPYMRPGYLLPVHDLEAGQAQRSSAALSQFCVDFSDRIYEVMRIRPLIYVNQSYANYINSTVPAVHPHFWIARYPYGSGNPYLGDLQVDHPPPSPSTANVYGKWNPNHTVANPYPDGHPWSFWQYGSGDRLQSFNNGNSNLDGNVAQGGIEFVKDFLVPAVWWHDSSGEWTTLTNWNSGQTPVQPVPGPGQVTPVATGPLPTSRLPGNNDTIILDRPTANITVTLSSGTHTIRKLYMREALNITGGSLTVNYVPSPDSTTNGAQFSGPVTLSGSGSLSVHTLQVDTNRTFTLSGGTVTLNTINLMPHGSLPAKIAVNGNVTLNPLSNASAVIANGAGSGTSGSIDLGAGTRTLTIGNGTSDIDLSITVPVSNGGLTKAGAGTLNLTAANTYSGGTIVSTGRLLVSNTTGSGTGSGTVSVSSGATLGGTGTISGVVTINSGGTLAPGASIGTLTLNSAPVLSGTTVMEIDRNGGSPLADNIVLTSGTLTFGGTLQVTNIGAALQANDTFTLFTAGAYAGSFSSTNLPSLGSGLIWDLSNLTVSGTIKVVESNPSIPPSITTQPSNRTNIAGTVATFTVVAAGPDLNYQWRRNATNISDGGNISGTTLPTLTLDAVTQTDAASYTVVITNLSGSITSAVRTLTVIDPPFITAQPQNQAVAWSNNATFTVSATGSSPLDYRWRFNGVEIPGATASSYTVTNAKAANAGSYSVVITNTAGSVTSAAAALYILGYPAKIVLENIWNIQAGSRDYVTTGNTERGIALNALTGHALIVSRSAALPGSLGLFILNADTGAELGQMDVSIVTNNAIFKLNKIGVAADGVIYGVNLTVASSTAPLVIYRWANESAAPIVAYSGAPDGGTTARWGDSVAFRGSGVNTRIIVAGSSSTTAVIFSTSDGTNFLPTVLVPSPAVSAGTFSRGLWFGEEDSLYVKNRSVPGMTNYTYNIGAGTATASFGIPGLETNMLAIAVATNFPLLFGVISDNTSVVSNHSLKAYDISTPGSPVAVSNFTFLANSSGSSSNNPNFAGMADTDGYRVLGLDTQNGVVALRVIAHYPPTIQSQPQSQSVSAGQNAFFSVSADGAQPLGYQWRFNGGDISGATQSSYTRANAQLSHAGTYSVVVSNAVGTLDSSNAVLNVTLLFTAPAFTNQPQHLVVTQGVSATFTASASGNPAPTYQWRKNGTNINGATQTVYTISNTVATDAGSYTAVASNFVDSATSIVATLTVKVPPAITTQPQSQSIGVGGNATFSVTASGDAPLGYQWRFNGGNIANATQSIYTLSNAQPANAGSYSLVITNAVDTAISSNALLTIVLPPVITDHPDDVYARTGGVAGFNVTASGSGPLGYQWRRNGTNIATATNPSFSKSNLQVSDAGSYSVAVSNVGGVTVSEPALLSVSLMTPANIDSIYQAPDRKIYLLISGEPGNYEIQKATNITQWSVLTNLTATNSPFQVIDAETNHYLRYYRTRTLP